VLAGVEASGGGQRRRVDVPPAHVPHSGSARRESHRGTDEPGADNRKSLDRSHGTQDTFVRPMRIFSGIQPSGIVHLGNDLGAIRNYVALQSEYEAIYCIVDYHALTSLHDPDVLRLRTREMAASLLALGLDPDRCTLCVQSHRPEHTELAWLLATVTPVSWVERTPTYKETRQLLPHDVNHALLTYPLLQAADIVMYTATLVPVGRDQPPHLAPSREIVRSFTNHYSATFPAPHAVLPAARLACRPQRLVSLVLPRQWGSHELAPFFSVASHANDASPSVLPPPTVCWQLSLLCHRGVRCVGTVNKYCRGRLG